MMPRHLVQHQGDAVRIDALDVKGDDAAAQSRVCRTDQLEPGDVADAGGDGLVEFSSSCFWMASKPIFCRYSTAAPSPMMPA